MAKDNQKWLKMVGIGQIWMKMHKNGLELMEMAKMVKLAKIVKMVKITKIVKKMAKTLTQRSELPKLLKQSEK